MPTSQSYPNLRELWDFSSPAQTRDKFQSLLETLNLENNHPYRLEIITQITRTYSLEAKFDLGHRLLNENLSYIDISTPLVKTRYHLERGRLYNSNNEFAEALEQFYRAFDLAKSNQLHYLAVDAAHMIAIAEQNREISVNWNIKAIEYAEQSNDSEAHKWLGYLYNNLGWSYHDQEKFDLALAMFEKARDFHEENGNVKSLAIAKWTVGRAYRSLGQIEDALMIMHQLEDAAIQEDKPVDGYVFEELAELYLMLGDHKKSGHYFAEAYTILSQDIWLKRNEPDRLNRMKRLSDLN